MEIKYKILQGYEHTRDVTINEDELERAFGLFLLSGRWIFSGGAVDGKNIQTIVLDEHTTMGWNKEYKLNADDTENMNSKGVLVKSRNKIARTQERVKYLISTKQEHLIGKNVNLPALENNKVSEVTKSLADEMKLR